VKIGTAFPSKYIKAADLNDKEHLLTISGVKIEDVGGQGSEEDKPVIYFVGKSKGCVLNRTNAMAIASKYGDDTEEWVDKPVNVYPDTTMFQGKMVDCIRMRVPAAPADPNEDPIPF
jgi:hypothetical protein